MVGRRDANRDPVLSRKGRAGVISVVNVDGSGTRTLDVGRSAFLVSWLPPDGREIIFRGEQLTPDDPLPGIFAVRPDGTGLRMISTKPALDKLDYQGIGVSPDGTRVTYATEIGPTLHILDLQTGDDRELPSPPGITAQMDAVFSPDGRSVVYQRWYGVDRTQLVVAPADGSDTGIPIGAPSPVGPDGPDLNNYYFTPDGTAVIVNDGTEVTRRLPVDGSAGTVVSTGSMTFAAMQRLAP